MNYIVSMSTVTMEQFNKFKEKALKPDTISDYPTHYLIFYDLNACARKQFPELASRCTDSEPFVFHNWYISNWDDKGESYYTIGPREGNRFKPSWLVELDSYGESFFIVRTI